MDFTNIIQSVLNKAQSLAGEPRIPFMFGSVKSLGGVPPIGDAQDFLNTLLHPDLQAVASALNPTSNASSSSLFSLTKFIRLMVNPDTLSITPYVRIPEVKTGGGRMYYHWLDDDGRAVEAYRLILKGQTGNIRPGAPDSNLKLYWFMKLRELSLEPYWVNMSMTKSAVAMEQITEASQTYTPTNRVRNYQYIMLSTVGLPMPIVFQGFYMKPIVHIESAARQFSIGWDIDFVIETMQPRLEDISALSGWALLSADMITNLVGSVGALAGGGL